MSDKQTLPDFDSALRKQYPCMNADVCGGGRGAYTCWNCKVRERGGEVRTLHSLHTVDINTGQSGVTLRNGDKWGKASGEEAPTQAPGPMCVGCVGQMPLIGNESAA